MPSSLESGFATQLRRLPGQLLVALVNGTAILVIVASVLALFAYSKIQGLASNVATTMTEAVLARVDVDPQIALAQLEGLAADVHGLAAAFKDGRAKARAPLTAAQIEQLNSRLDALQTSIARLNDSRSLLINDAFAAIGHSLADGLGRLRDCSLPAR